MKTQIKNLKINKIKLDSCIISKLNQNHDFILTHVLLSILFQFIYLLLIKLALSFLHIFLILFLII